MAFFVPDADGDARSLGGFHFVGLAFIDLDAGFVDAGAEDVVFLDAEGLGGGLGLFGNGGDLIHGIWRDGGLQVI